MNEYSNFFKIWNFNLDRASLVNYQSKQIKLLVIVGKKCLFLHGDILDISTSS